MGSLLLSLAAAALALAPAAPARTACKAVTTPAQARGCAALEVDLNLTKDGVWVLAHDADFRGRPIDEQAFDEVKDALVSLDAFAKATEKEHFTLVNFDLKTRYYAPGAGAITEALEKHRDAIGLLASRSPVVATTPIPARYVELARYAGSAGMFGVEAGFELIDYDNAAAARWGIHMPWWQRLLLPVARALNRAYYSWHASEISWLVVLESTAGRWSEKGPKLLCWTRDGETGTPPQACAWALRPKS
jgi:hypothetical protein